MKTTDAFENTICILFGTDFWSSAVFQEKYNRVLEDVKMYGDCNCAEYGGCSSTIDLMIYLREKMKTEGLCPDVSMDEAEEQFLRRRNELLESNKKFKRLFTSTYNYELSKENEKYDTDDWDYVDAECDDKAWLCEKKKNGKVIRTHRYYNEIDHYLTYLVGAIRRNVKNDCIREEGARLLKEDLNNLAKAI